MINTPWLITERPIKIALVGCGRISKNHFLAIERHKEQLILTAVCDRDAQAAQKSGEQYGVRSYSCLDEMLQECDADIVTLCTPSGLHAAQAVRVAQSGKHVITEKPMATRWEDGVRMVRACHDAGVRLFVVKQNRLNPTLQLLKKAIDKNRFGTIYLANVNVFWTRPQEYYDQDEWRGTWEFDGGAFMNQASHHIDLICWLLGPVQSVQAMMATLARHIEAEDTGVMTLRWCNGALGSVNVTMLTYPKNYEASITILGEKGTVRLGGVAVNEIQQWEFAEPHEEDAGITEASYQTESVYGSSHPLYYSNVINTLKGIEEPLIDGHEGLGSLEVLIAAYRASQEGNTVHLPLELPV